MSDALKKPWVLTVLISTVLLLSWEAYVMGGYVSPLILPRPVDIAVELIRMLQQPSTYYHLGVTLYEAVAGFLFAALIGVMLGVVLAKLPPLERALQPIIIAIQVVPKIVLVPLFILWFGFGMTSKIVIAAVLAFLPILSNTLLGVKSIEAGHRDVLKSLGATSWQRLIVLELPSAMPAVLTGMEVGIIFSMIGAVIGEFLAGTAGLGHLAIAKMNAFEAAGLFATIILLSIISGLLYFLIALMRSSFTGWHATADNLATAH
ncbi:ABC transporter permease [Sinorhizobium mexicanum]|uniref:ABC transporter permease n=1 Tax=Sinorhizobium mexicanum TaxID=375549 RepID=A0A859R697_9HYPH|nr:ABC transporter permease [Sinorhizobium mexicanum]MBP1884370.1 NitT/TauT family transport system permease protein [Sinorhizobium mexicanum]QLL65048.1 ABC transporter permease [Sinorhizobium mexicanum]